MQLLGINKAEKLFLIFFGTLALIAIVVPFVSFTNPKKQRAIKLDQQRINQFNSISDYIRDYYESNAALPRNLEFISEPDETRDPETQVPFEYEILGRNTYNLCTTFSTDSTETPIKGDIVTIDNKDVDYTRTKGYDCITFQIRTSDPTPEVTYDDLESEIEGAQ